MFPLNTIIAWSINIIMNKKYDNNNIIIASRAYFLHTSVIELAQRRGRSSSRQDAVFKYPGGGCCRQSGGTRPAGRRRMRIGAIGKRILGRWHVGTGVGNDCRQGQWRRWLVVAGSAREVGDDSCGGAVCFFFGRIASYIGGVWL
jgi:hypothetical protein